MNNAVGMFNGVQGLQGQKLNIDNADVFLLQKGLVKRTRAVVGGCLLAVVEFKTYPVKSRDPFPSLKIRETVLASSLPFTLQNAGKKKKLYLSN